MSDASIIEKYMEPLLAGDRASCRTIARSFAAQSDPTFAYHELIWPAMEQVDRLYRDDQINRAVEHMATRINRCVADQIQMHLIPRDANGRRILIACADGEPEELGAQMCADLFEANGWDVYFVGGGIPNDEVLSLVGQLRPDILLVFGTRPQGVPGVRALIDLIREVGANPTMNIMISGGVFNRAEGLWKEVNADLFARTAREAIPIAEAAEPRQPEVRVPGVPKKRRRRRRSPLLAAAEA
ncbi:MAG TPA: cobalamin-dependent protein [Phycisphaerae bacterium]|jgi:methanogenic corrinoid protein MtbC1